MNTLNGKVAVITGASRGLGKAIATLFAQAGAKVVLAARSPQDIGQIAAELQAGGHAAVTFTCDVSDPQQVEALARFAINTYGHFDVWVNNAGVAGPYGATFDLSPEQFLSVLRTNMFGVYHGSRMAMRHFLPRKSGKLINILGAGSKKPAPNQNAYGSTKAWIRVFTLALAAETRGSGVGVFALQPGLMDTDLLTEVVTFQEHAKRLREFMPFLIRAAGKKPEVAARKALWLASSATDGRTGLDVSVGSRLTFMLGFLREGLRRLLRLPTRPIEMHVTVIPPALEPLPGIELKDTNLAV
ncbi:MAG: SDR family oxidoreductase [Anaerolineales bacterium]|jgi:NAD(P)-dependent dehydrogenase (short-subunit alcohol dehydrogenase family)